MTISGNEVNIDGFNIIITLEVLLCDSILFSCMDGTIRDLAALRGTYRIILARCRVWLSTINMWDSDMYNGPRESDQG